MPRSLACFAVAAIALMGSAPPAGAVQRIRMTFDPAAWSEVDNGFTITQISGAIDTRRPCRKGRQVVIFEPDQTVMGTGRTDSSGAFSVNSTSDNDSGDFTIVVKRKRLGDRVCLGGRAVRSLTTF